MFSDVHAPLQILLSVNDLNNNDGNSNTIRKTNHLKAKIKSWENEKVTDSQENIDEEKLHRSSDNRLIVRGSWQYLHRFCHENVWNI